MRFRGVAGVLCVVGLLALPTPAHAQSIAAPGDDEPELTVRPWAYALGGLLGVLGLGLGAYWGLKAISQQRDADALCPGRGCDDPRGVALSREAVQAGDRATVATALGLAAMGFGVLLYVSADDPAPRRVVSIGSWIGPGSGGARARFAF